MSSGKKVAQRMFISNYSHGATFRHWGGRNTNDMIGTLEMAGYTSFVQLCAEMFTSLRQRD